MNNSSQITEQSKRLRELKQELNQIKGGQLNKTVIQQTQNELSKGESKTNQTQIITPTQKIDIDYSDDSDD